MKMKILSASITNTISHLTRRGYASQSQAGALTTNLMLKKGSQDSAKISWVPDPVTGFYRPENQAHQLDQRAIFINNKLTPH